jgi:hypothetical protein
MESGATAFPVANGAVGFGGPGQLQGWSLRETAGAVATVRIREVGVAGKILASIGLAANDDDRAWYGPLGVDFATDLYIEVVAGAVEGAIYAAA